MTDLVINNELQWAQALLPMLTGVPTNENTCTAIIGWELMEGGNWSNDAKYNPLNTTWDAVGSVNINSVGVKAYTSWEQGLQATVDTLNNGLYGAILSELKASNELGVAIAVGQSRWGTPNFSSLLPRAAEMYAQQASTPPPAPVTSSVPPFPGVDMSFGFRGAELAIWQERMQQRGWVIAADGVYGLQTMGVVRAFQQEKGLGVDGVIGPVTWAAAWTSPVT